MIGLILAEIKKMFQNKILLFILLMIILLPPFLVPELDKHNRSGMVTDMSGNSITYYQCLEQQDQLLANYKGDLLDEKLWKRIEEDYKKDQFLVQLDPRKIEIKYGRGLSYQEVWDKLGELDESFFFDEEERNHVVCYNSSGIGKIYHLKERLSKEYYQEHDMTKYSFSSDIPVKDKKEQELFNHKIDYLKHVYIGSTLSFEHLFSVLNIVAFTLSFFFLFITPSIINKEGSMLSLLKTSKQGKRKLVVAKILTILLLSIIIPLVATLFTTLIIHLRYGLHHWNTSAMLISNSYLFYSIFVLYMKRLFLMMLGCLGLSMIGIFLSSVFKNAYVSLGVMIAFYLIWIFSIDGGSVISWKVFTPMNILLDSGRSILEGGYLYLGKHLFSLEMVMYLFWFFGTILLFYFSYVGYTRRQITNKVS